MHNNLEDLCSGKLNWLRKIFQMTLAIRSWCIQHWPLMLNDKVVDHATSFFVDIKPESKKEYKYFTKNSLEYLATHRYKHIQLKIKRVNYVCE